MAEDRLPAWCAPSIDAISAATLTFRDCAISLSAFQNASSRLTLVQWPAIRIERLITGDCIGGPQYPPSLRGAQRATKQSRILNIRVLDCFAFARNEPSPPRPRHALRPHQAVELLGRDITQPQRLL